MDRGGRQVCGRGGMGLIEGWGQADVREGGNGRGGMAGDFDFSELALFSRLNR